MKLRDAAVLFSRVPLWDLSDEEDITFTDIPKEAYYHNAVAYTAKANLVTRKSTNQFSPNDLLTRGEMAVLLTRAFNLQVDANVNVEC